MGSEEAHRSERIAVTQGTDAEGSSRREAVTEREGPGGKQRWRLEKEVGPKTKEIWEEEENKEGWDGGKMTQPLGRQGGDRSRVRVGRSPDGQPDGERGQDQHQARKEERAVRQGKQGMT